MIGAISGNYTGYGTYGNYYAMGNSETVQENGFSDAQTKINPLTGQPENVDPKEEAKKADPDSVKKPGRQSAPDECETCKNRKYQDGSDEANVSFKTAAHVSPEAAASAVRAHEGQHVSNAYKKAAQAENAKVISANVTIHTAICPECGKSYVSGGVTQTAIKYTNEANPYQKNRMSADGVSMRGANINYAV